MDAAEPDRMGITRRGSASGSSSELAGGVDVCFEVG